MGYATEMYGVDLGEIERMIRERDFSILEKTYRESPILFQGNGADGGLTVGQAMAYILNGTASKIPSDEYGYAFKEIVRSVGVSLPDEDAVGSIDALELDSPLGGDYRCPVDFEFDGDFPFITYLTKDEVREEASRLKKLDLDYPDDSDIEEGRKGYAAAIFEAAKQGLAVVSFYQ